jgi:hypothetical protein
MTMAAQQPASSSDTGRGSGTPMEVTSQQLGSSSPRWGGGVANSMLQSFGRLRRHDSEFSVSSNYDYGSSNDLNVWQGATLLTADCMGVGLLALPNDIHVLGLGLGLGFLLLNLPINLYAGTILSDAAGYVEQIQGLENEEFDEFPSPEELQKMENNKTGDDNSPKNEEEEEEEDQKEEDVLSTGSPLQNNGKRVEGKNYETIAKDDDNNNGDVFEDEGGDGRHHQSLHHDTATFDFIGMTSALFHKSQATRWVMILFYANIFLVLGDYILVMSHAVAALLGESWVCIPQAGIVASSLMFAVSQLRTMANLGRSASVVSLAALFIVVIQCLYFANTTSYQEQDNDQETTTADPDESTTILRKLSAIGSIGFAVGSQKLLLNIRHELKDRDQAPKSLALALTAFGTFYVAIVLCAGPSK